VRDMEARGRGVQHGGDEAGAEAGVLQRCDLAAHCHGQPGTVEMWWWTSVDSRCKCKLRRKAAKGVRVVIRSLTSMWSLLGNGIRTVCPAREDGPVEVQCLVVSLLDFSAILMKWLGC
jgi:hypothetical protein